MKKYLLPKKSMLVIALTALLAVACGLKFEAIDFSTHEPAQGEVLTVVAHLAEAVAGNDSENPQNDRTRFFAVRVPQDWSAQGINASYITKENETVAVAMTDCEAYAKYCEFCFPRTGYKWIGFASEEKGVQGQFADIEVKLLVAGAVGEYNLDFFTGGWAYDASDLLNEDGSVNVANTFGWNTDRTDTNCYNAFMNDVAFKSSEYLFNAGTVTAEELEARKNALSSNTKYIISHTNKNGEEKVLPIAPDIANITSDLNLKVTVKEGAGVEGVNADAANGAPVYFDLQGRKVESPSAGTYLVKRNGKVTKQVIK